MRIRTWNDLGMAVWVGMERLAVAVGPGFCAVAVVVWVMGETT